MSIEIGKDQYTLMKGKIQYLTEKMSRVVCLTYDLIPNNLEDYNNQVSQVYQSMRIIDPLEKELSQHDELILGKIEGQYAFSDFKMIIEQIVGQVNEGKLKLYLKQKTEQRNYGLSMKDKNCTLKQVKKLQYLNKYFDIKQINQKRKHNTLYRTYIKNLQKFIHLFNKTDQNNNQQIQNLWQQYQIFMKQQKKFISHLKQIENIPNISQKQIIIHYDQNRPLQQQEVKQQQKSQFKNQQENKIIQQKNKQQNKNKSPKKQLKTHKRNKNQQVEPPNINAQTIQANDNLEQKVIEQLQVVPTAISAIAKKDDKQKKLDLFFIKKPLNPIKLFRQNADEIIQNDEKPNILVQDLQSNGKKDVEPKSKLPQCWQFMSHSSYQKPNISELRYQFKSFKMQNQQLSNQPYFINMIITLSTIQYYDYLMKIDREVDFTAPFKKIKQILYFQDQSQQFEGESASGNMQDQQEDEQALSQGNKTILDDDHLSNQEISSCQSNQMDLKVQYGKGMKWIYNSKIQNNQISMQIINHFEFICLQDQSSPLPIQQQQQEKIQLIITPQIWHDIYKITHGYFGIKDFIIKQISNILPNVSKNWIDTMLKQRTQKIGNQRFVLKAFIEDLKERIVDIQQVLEDIQLSRNYELKRIRDQKNQQKDLKLQKDILECTGSRYIINLMKQLKQKGYKQMRKKQLIDFIKQRNGQQWQKIKIEMNTMSMSIPINKIMLIRDQQNIQIQCEQEVVVDEDQYNKQITEKQQQKQNSQASTKQKQTNIKNKQQINNNNYYNNDDKRLRKRTIKSNYFQKTLQFPLVSNRIRMNQKGQKRQTKPNNIINKESSDIKQTRTIQQIAVIQKSINQRMIQQNNQNQMISQQIQQIQYIEKKIQQFENYNNGKQINYELLNKTSEKFQNDS